MSEVWKAIVGYEGLYEVSDLGRVRSLTRQSPVGRKPCEPRLRKTREGRGGYIKVNLAPLEGKQRVHFVHSLVAEAFIGPRPEGCQCCHNDGSVKNNVPANLRWDFVAENQADRLKHGTDSRGLKHPAAKLSDEQVAEVKRRCLAGENKGAIASDYGISRSLVWAIGANRHRKYVEVEA